MKTHSSPKPVDIPSLSPSQMCKGSVQRQECPPLVQFIIRASIAPPREMFVVECTSFILPSSHVWGSVKMYITFALYSTGIWVRACYYSLTTPLTCVDLYIAAWSRQREGGRERGRGRRALHCKHQSHLSRAFEICFAVFMQSSLSTCYCN